MYCGNSFGKIDFVCPRCELLLRRKMLDGGYSIPFLQGYKGHSLFVWNQETDIWVRPLVYGLKGGDPKNAYNKLAEMLTYELLKTYSLDDLYVFIPAPASSGLSYDHASVLSHCLADLWKGEVFQPFKKSESTQLQKRLSKSQRRKKSVEIVDPKFFKYLKLLEKESYNIVFVDDVYTTGSTCRAVLKNFYPLSKLHSWTIFYKAMLKKKNHLKP